MSGSGRKLRACRSCSQRKVKCLPSEGDPRCRECVKRSKHCERPEITANHNPCDNCKRSHVACEWSGAGPCTFCSSARSAASCSLASENSGGSDRTPSFALDPMRPSSSPQTHYFDIVLNKN
ncbi:hypothetical protein BD309DRAFT_962865 [Dichomitus squalens]|nr:hypothetical protein BD309DRAFT_962865 [Dichomitus squalens]